ncbi:hypothetical protein [Duganella sp. BJB1802]|uniref:hypothetical protein n=1 Tax=Duganella sp. BJB1802 TaxID=2744575 RepID=UPI0028119AD1|nr:hypothetical protein [Duganella sp. BJB1802]
MPPRARGRTWRCRHRPARHRRLRGGARRLRADPATRGIRLIALTGYGLAEDLRRVMDAGFDRHLVKPVDIDQLTEAIGGCVRVPVRQ